MTTEVAERVTQRRRRLGALGFALEWRVDWLQREYLRGSPGARADMARLRRGLGKPVGSVPEIWEITIGAVPEELASRGDKPSKAEQAAHVALTLYAVHQQSRTEPMHVPDISFGDAVRRLRERPDVSEEAVTRRFMAVATAETVNELIVHVRGLINQLKAHKIDLDYAAFADDVVGLLTPGRASTVRLEWGRHFYRTDASSESGHGDDAGDDPENDAAGHTENTDTENTDTENVTEETGAQA